MLDLIYIIYIYVGVYDSEKRMTNLKSRMIKE